MNDRLSSLESRVDQLAQQIRELESRLSALDHREAAAQSPSAGSAAAELDFSSIVSLAGRALLALGGAYLLRALTEAGILPRTAGVSLAFVYAGAWVVLARRAGSAGRSASAGFHIGSAALVFCPLVWEATVRLKVLGPEAAALALLTFTVAVLAVARPDRLEAGAWVGVLGAQMTAVTLLFGTRDVAPFAATLVGIGLATLVFWDSKASPLAWVSAAVADLAVLLLTFGVFVQNASLSIPAAMLVQLALFLGYFGALLRRMVGERKEATLFEMAQSGAATVIGYGGAVAVAETPGEIATILIVGLAGAVAGYGAAFRSVAARGEERNQTFLSALAIAIVLFATGKSLARPEWLWAILAVLAFALGKRIPSIALALHGSVYLLAAAAASGLLKFFLWALAAPSIASWPPFPSTGLLVLGAAVVSTVLGVPEASGWGRWARVPRGLALSIASLAFTGGAVRAFSQATGADPAQLAAIRTVVVSATSVALAAVSRSNRAKEAEPLSYALLVLCGIKLVIEDFPRGRPATLFLGLGFYGAALILASRLARRPS